MNRAARTARWKKRRKRRERPRAGKEDEEKEERQEVEEELAGVVKCDAERERERGEERGGGEEVNRV